MTKKMLINATHPEENRVAIVEDGKLSELDIEIAGHEQTKGNIYKAAVVRVEPGLQAAFIDYGADRLGFLQMGEIHPSYFPAREEGEGRGRPRITDILHRGQDLLVQVLKEERGTKGAALTTYLSVPGRYLVLVPESSLRAISRKVEEEAERKTLKEALKILELPQNMGVILRTAGIGQKSEEFRRDLDYLLRLYRTIQETAKKVKAPTLIYKESNLVIRSIRDYFSADMDEVLVDDPKVFQEARDFFQQIMPDYARLVKLHQERRPIFSRYQIEEQIETITQNKVLLPSGGSIVIDVTEALVAVDVNSGKMAGEQGVEATAYKTNLEAAEEIARQLRLRDLGGLIVIDFIDMRDRGHIREVEKRLKAGLKNDKARVTVGRISQFGLLEMSRQRIKPTLAEGAYRTCPHCGGSGHIKSVEAQAVAFLRKIHSAVAKGKIARVEGMVPLEVAIYLLNTKREELLAMEQHHRLTVHIKGRPDFVAGQSELQLQRREAEEEAAQPPGEVTLAALLETPLPPAEPAEPAAPAAEEKAAAAPEGGKKKRRRRRKKKPAEEAAAQAPEEREAGGAAPPEVAVAALPAEPTAEPEGEKEEARKKPRRRRRKKPAGAEVPAAAESQGPAPAEEEIRAVPGSAVETPPAPTPGPEEKKEAKKRTRRKKPVDETSETAKAPEEKTKPVRQRKKAEPKKEPEGEKAASAAADEAEPKAKNKPASGRRKTKAEPKETVERAERAAEPPAAEKSGGGEEKKTEKSAGRARRKPAAKTAEPGEGEKSAEKKPRRKQAAKKKTEAPEERAGG